MKTCSSCKISKPLDQFWADRRKAHGRTSTCIPCRSEAGKARRRADPEKQRAANKARYWNNRDAERERHTVKKYGVSLADYDRMLAEQGGACAVCGRTQERTLDIDHCHATKVVRGLLCTSCNRMIGHGGDSPTVLRFAADYLESSRKRPQPSSKPTSKRGRKG